MEADSHLENSNSTAQYLYKFDETHGKDVVLMSDCYDTEVRLRLQAIVDRYLDINFRASDKLELFSWQEQRRANWYSPGHLL